MQWLAALCVRRPVFATVIILVLTVVGLFSYGKLGVDRFPKIDIPTVVVVTTLPGASPEQMESDVSDKIEAAVNTISGIDELRSTSSEGVSQVIVMFVLEKNIDVGVQEVRDKIQGVLRDLPTGIDPPVVNKIDPDASPILTLALSAKAAPREITEFADKTVRRELESLSGVGQVTIIGGQARQIHVWMDPEKLQRFSVTAAEVERALRTQNIELPSGRIEAGPKSLTVRTRGRVERVEDFAKLVVAQRDGSSILLGQVARVEDGTAEPESVGYKGGESAVLLSIRKQSGTNTVEVVHALKSRLEDLEKRLPEGYKIEVARDQSEFIENSVGAVKEHLLLGAVFAALIVLMFLGNARSTVIAALAIPISIIATFAVMNMAGFTLNAITLLALTLAVGIVIDDAIVVLEIIWKKIDEDNMPPIQAAVEGTAEIGLAVLATTLSLVAVFMPVAFMGGIVGRFMNSFGLTMSFAIMVSLVVSFVLTPMLCSRWLRKKLQVKRGKNGQVEAPALDVPGESGHGHGHGGPSKGLYGLIERAYMAALGFCLRHRWVVVLACVVSLASIPVLGKMANANFLPTEDESQLEVILRMPEGTSLDETRVVASRLARAIEATPGVRYAVTTIGDDAQKTPNLANLYVKLVPATERALGQIDLMDQIRRDVLPPFQGEGRQLGVNQVQAFSGGGANYPVMFQISGPDMARISAYNDTLLAKLSALPGVADATSSLIVGKPEVRVHIDRQKAAELGVSIADITSTLRLLVGGYEVSNFNDKSEQYEVHARAEAISRATPDSLRQLSVPSTKLGSVTLDHVVNLTTSSGPSKIDRVGRRRSAMVMANVQKGSSEGAIIEGLTKAAKEMKMDASYASGPVGRSKELGKAAKNFGIAFAMSFIFMYLVLAAQFESWLHPVTILLSLPLTIPFALASIILFQQSLNIFSMLGILVLFGVVKKNSILQIDHTIALRREGLGRHDAMMRSNRDRLRPILMTTLAFVAGMVPLVMSSGAGAATNRATGFVIIGGQTFSLFLTLVATPVAYSLFDDVSMWFARMGKRFFGSGNEDVQVVTAG